ncbi:MAG: hypothetical protein Q4F65_10260 [Propionibacteriaceae bacterium]|nr:hypothetical protein [Propionibacteriaceae bacterium]
MTQDPTARLQAAVERRAEADRLRRSLDTAERQAGDAAQRLADAEAALQREQADVERLEGLSWTRIMSAVRGERDVDLAREQAQARAAQLQVDAARRVADETRAAADELQRSLRQLGPVEDEYRRALADQTAHLSATDTTVGPRLTEVADQLGRLEAETRELDEARAAGADALAALHSAQEYLQKAKDWSTADTFFGGGLLSDLAKYDRLDQVSSHLERADAALTRYGRELGDVRLAAVEGVNISGVAATFDFFFDNIVSDWATLRRVTAASDRVRDLIRAVESTQASLHARLQGLAGDRATLTHERDHLVRDASGVREI